MFDFAPDDEQLSTAEEDARRLGIDPNMLKYQGKTAIIITRVSTIDQNKKYGLKYQDRLTRAFLKLHGVNVLETIIDTYTGMDFNDRKGLAQLKKRIAALVAAGLVHLIAMWKLDRLGRKGIQREIVRAEFKSYGLGVVSTFADEHADDDTPLGELVRAIYAFKAEQEWFDMLERSREGKIEKLLEGKILGSGIPAYGWKFNAAHDMYELETEEEALIYERMFVWFVRERLPIRAICTRLNNDGVLTRKTKLDGKFEGQTFSWQAGTVSKMLRDPKAKGEFWYNKSRTETEKRPGRKVKARYATPKEEQILIRIPKIVSVDLWEEAQRLLVINQEESARNNCNVEETLLRSGHIFCGYCHSNMTYRRNQKPPTRGGQQHPLYTCIRGMAIGRGCKPHSIKAETVHLAAWEKAKEIIRDPQEVEKAIRAWSTANPVQREEEVIRKGLKDVQDNLEAIRRRLKTLQLDAGTEASLALSARELAAQEQEYLTELSKTVKVFEGWQKLEEELILFRQWCTEVRSQIDEPEYIPTNPDLRRAIVFFGIYVEVWGKDHEPDRFQVHVHPLALVDIFSY